MLLLRVSNKRLAVMFCAAAALMLAACSRDSTESAPAAQTPSAEAANAGNLATAAPPVPAEDAAADPLFAKAWIDIDEWRDAPVPHRYVHGGFTDTETRFSYYFPPAGDYEGRFFQHITPVPDSENLAQNEPAGEGSKIGFSIASGGYFVETNGGGRFDLATIATQKMDPTISAYRANAAAARYSRVVARAIFGGGRPWGYAYGGSGGGYRTIGAAENTSGVWDGFVPYVIGSTMAIPNSFTARLQAMRVLRERFPGIVDAVDAGGSGDPEVGLDPLEKQALQEVTAMGFPVRSWFGWKTMGLHGFAALYGGVVMADPTYFTDFWTKPGYLGHDDPGRFARDRIQFTSTITEPVTAAEAARLGINTEASREIQRGAVDTAFKIPEGAAGARIVGFRLGGKPPQTWFLGGDLLIGSGDANGRSLPVARIVDDVVVLGLADQSVASALRVGDSVTVDNSNFLAIETYHRHQVPGPDYAVWDAWRKADGTPMYPQRERLIGPGFVMATSGSLQTGKINGKMIVVASLWDREAYPWQADWYRQRVSEHLGDRTDDTFRLWYTDRALHGDLPNGGLEDPTRIVSYLSMLHQALRDVARWAETGVAPAASTRYTIEHGQVSVPSSAVDRSGIHPVVRLETNGSQRIEVKAGTEVRFDGHISAPPGTGSVTAAEWDMGDSEAGYTAVDELPAGESVDVSASHVFSKPGTWFVTLRGSVERNGDRDAIYTQLRNLDRVRVVVTE